MDKKKEKKKKSSQIPGKDMVSIVAFIYVK